MRERERKRGIIDTFADISKCIFISTRLKERIDKCGGLVVYYNSTRWDKILYLNLGFILLNKLEFVLSFRSLKLDMKNMNSSKMLLAKLNW